jgi:hypothetical protein
MTESSVWQDNNAKYLSAALAWLRARLERRVRRNPSSTPIDSPSPAEASRALWRQPRATNPTPNASISPRLSPSSQADPIEETNVEAAAREMANAAKTQPPPALMIAAQRLGLTRFEQEVLLLCAAMELDTGIAALCAAAQQDGLRPFPTFALALALFDDPSWDALSPERPLRYWRLIEINQPGALPLTVSPLRADERVVDYLKGLNYLDDRLAPLLSPFEIPEGEVEIPPSQEAVVETVLTSLNQTEPGRSLPVVQLLGTDSHSKQLVAWHVATSLGLRVFRISAAMIPPQSADLEALARLWQRESLLLPLALFVTTEDSETGATSEGSGAPLSRFLARANGLTFLDSREARRLGGLAFTMFQVSKPTLREQKEAWAAALGASADGSPAVLCGQFSLNLSSIKQVSHAVLRDGSSDPLDVGHRAWEACRAITRPRLDALAHPLDAKATWDDIVLPLSELESLRNIADQVSRRTTVYEDWGFRQKMNRGLGINALFAGDSGTGKTMAAEVIANDRRLNLLRIDLSAVVSKYIGETEKNLRHLFDAAEDGGAILFFDEADALFGKRSEVKDSHDRYANIEINYLLQRMESYRGLAILATNMKSALDSAFMRRLRFVVNFPFPGAAERKLMWQKVFPSASPRENLDYDRLARLNLTGGNIHNIALNAAFLAARAGGVVTMQRILDAARSEFRKLEKPINDADFRWPQRAGAVA